MDSKHDLKHQNRLKTKRIYFVSRKITENCTLDSILETSGLDMLGVPNFHRTLCHFPRWNTASDWWLEVRWSHETPESIHWIFRTANDWVGWDSRRFWAMKQRAVCLIQELTNLGKGILALFYDESILAGRTTFLIDVSSHNVMNKSSENGHFPKNALETGKNKQK